MPILTPPVDIPEWATDETQVIEPSAGKKAVGFIPTEKPASQTLNWILWDLSEWAAYYKSYFDTITNSNAVFDDTLKVFKMAQGRVQSEMADTSTSQSGSGLSRIVVRNTNGTANNFADFSFSNQNDVVTSKISSKFVNHTNKETNLSFWSTPASGSLTEYLTILGANGYLGVGLNTPLNKMHVVSIETSSRGTSLIQNTGDANTFLSIINTFDSQSRNYYLATVDSAGANVFQIRSSSFASINPYTATPIFQLTEIGDCFVNGLLGVGTLTPSYKVDIETTSTNTFRVKNVSTLQANISGFFNDSNAAIQNIIYGSAYASGTVFGVGANGAAIASNTVLSIGTTGANTVSLSTNGLERLFVFSSGGTMIGSATGGDKGSGTLNAAGDIYKNNSAYTNPDYAFEHFFSGKIEKFKKNAGAKTYKGLKPLIELEEYVKNNFRLPGISDKGMGIFKRSDFILEKIEELHLYIFEMNKRILNIEKLALGK